jgi:hypothetical protein
MFQAPLPGGVINSRQVDVFNDALMISHYNAMFPGATIVASAQTEETRCKTVIRRLTVARCDILPTAQAALFPRA